MHFAAFMLPVVAFAVSAGIFSFTILTGLVDVVRVLQRRFSLSERLRWITQGQEISAKKPFRLNNYLLACLGAGLVLAVVWHHAVLSPWWIVFGGLVGWMLVSTRPAARGSDLQDLEVLVSEVRGLGATGQSIFVPLELAAQGISDESLRAAVEEALRRYRAGKPVDESLEVLRGRHAFLDRLVMILSHASRANDEAIKMALLGLEGQIRKGRSLLDRSRVVMRTNYLTLRILQVVNLIALGIVTVLPVWHSYFSARPASLMAASLVALLGSWYFAAEMRRMEELV